MGRTLEVVKVSLFLLLATHGLLNHKCVHVDVWLETSTVSRISETVVLEMLPGLEFFLGLSENLMVAFDVAAFQIELLLDGVDASLIVLQQLVQLVHVHLTNGTVVVGHI